MDKLSDTEIMLVSGGWAKNEDLIPTVVRGAGLGAMAGAIGGPAAALSGAVIGGIMAYGNHSSNSGKRKNDLLEKCKVKPT